MKSLRNTGVVFNIVGMLLTCGMMFSTTTLTGGTSDLLFTLGLYGWVLLPFVILIVLTLTIHRKGFSRAAHVAILFTSILVVVLSVLVYGESILRSESSTSALVFIFIPLYALPAIAAAYTLSWSVLRFLMPKAGA